MAAFFLVGQRMVGCTSQPMPARPLRQVSAYNAPLHQSDTGGPTMFRRIRIAFPILVAAFVAYLGVAGAADNPKKEGKAAVVVTEKDDGKKVKLAKGDTLEVRLEMQGGTGFSWKVAKNDDKVLMP